MRLFLLHSAVKYLSGHLQGEALLSLSLPLYLAALRMSGLQLQGKES